MKTPNRKALLAGAAIAGLITGTSARLHATETSQAGIQASHAGTMIADDSSGKHACAGQNSCKGQGGCKTSDQGCKAKNSCKGKGGCATDGSKA
jgi:predicted ribosomally synthesized peptide with SipW-like signal peptide